MRYNGLQSDCDTKRHKITRTGLERNTNNERQRQTETDRQ